jgi:hypothetical protein
VRVPIPLVILLILALVGGIWWKNTRQMDFLTPPSPAKLAAVRQQWASLLPRPEPVPEVAPVIAPVVEVPPLPPVAPPKPVVEVGDLTTPVTLQSYGEISPQGAGRLIEIATALEEKSEPRRALLAWERVMDLTKPDATQAIAAISAIKRLRPTQPDWNLKPETAISIHLHASTGKKLAKSLTPILEAVARDLQTASSGIVKVRATVTAGKTTTKSPAPVALWLTGTTKKNSPTETLSFTASSPDLLRAEVLKTVFLLLHSQLARTTAYTPPVALGEKEDPLTALSFRVSRLCWSEFAAGLNLPPKKQP